MSRAPLVVKMAGGSLSLAPMSIAAFEVGKSFIVLPAAPMVRRYGRHRIFLVGTLFSFISTALGVLGVIYMMPWLIIASTFFAGTYTGIAYGYRYAAIEIAQEHREFAVTLCLSGGVLAAIIGPLGAILSADWFVLVRYENIGVYGLNAIFVGINFFLLLFVSFPADKKAGTGDDNICTEQKKVNHQKRENTLEAGVYPCDSSDTKASSTRTEKNHNAKSTMTICQVVSNRIFFFATIISTMTWVCMSIPLSTVGLVLNQLDPPLSDGAVEATFIAHFLGMFLPGLGTGKFIQNFGFCAAGFGSIALYIFATVLNIFAQAGEPVLWIIGQFFVGMAWNLGFTSATVMLSTSCPPDDRELACRTQSYSDFVSFLGGGIITISAGYMLDSNHVDNILEGWQLLNYVQFFFIGIMLVVILMHGKTEKG